MFWSKKKKDENAKDPATKYGRVIQEHKNRQNESSPKKQFSDKVIKEGYDSDFVYYEE
jgi:hypothetical protein